MRQKYTKMQELIEVVRERKAKGETNREIANSLGLTKKQVKQLINRENQRERLIKEGHMSRVPKVILAKTQIAKKLNRIMSW